MKKLLLFLVASLLWWGGTNPLLGQEKTIPDNVEIDRSDSYEDQLEAYLRAYLVDQYDSRAAEAWNRDYGSIDALKRSHPTEVDGWR